MFYIHYDNSGRPDQFTGYKAASKEKAIELCNSLESKAYVSELIKVKSAWTGKTVDGFAKPCHCNKPLN